MASLPKILLKVALMTVLASLVHWILHMTWTMGFHKKIYDHAPGPCKVVEGIGANGSEGIHTLSDGLAFISSGFKYIPMKEATKDRKGQIFLFDFSQPLQPATPLTIEEGLTLHSPHGIGAWEDEKTGQVTLFVIDHWETEADRVEKFEFDRTRRVLRHKQSIKSDAFTYLNDIVATSASTFYATNTVSSRNLIIIYIEIFFLPRWGSVVYFDGQNARPVASGLCHPNGINISPDKRYVYMAAGMCQEIVIFERHDDNSVTLRETFPVGTLPDNLFVSRDSEDVWLAAGPIFWMFLRASYDPAIPAPSQVLRLKVKDGHVIDVFEVFMDTGKLLYASSSANYYKGAMLVGSVYDKLLYCEVRHID